MIVVWQAAETLVLLAALGLAVVASRSSLPGGVRLVLLALGLGIALAAVLHWMGLL